MYPTASLKNLTTVLPHLMYVFLLWRVFIGCGSFSALSKGSCGGREGQIRGLGRHTKGEMFSVLCVSIIYY